MPATAWRKSSYSSDQANCVVIAFRRPLVRIRDSKQVAGPALAFQEHRWNRFLEELGSWAGR